MTILNGSALISVENPYPVRRNHIGGLFDGRVSRARICQGISPAAAADRLAVEALGGLAVAVGQRLRTGLGAKRPVGPAGAGHVRRQRQRGYLTPASGRAAGGSL